MMMMENPKPEEKEEAPIISPPKKTAERTTLTNLQERLTRLGGVPTQPMPTTETAAVKESKVPNEVLDEKPKTHDGGKNALLARIMMAQERARKANLQKENSQLPPPPFPEPMLENSSQFPQPPPIEAVVNNIAPFPAPPPYNEIDEDILEEFDNEEEKVDEEEEEEHPAPTAPDFSTLYAAPTPVPVPVTEEEVNMQEAYRLPPPPTYNELEETQVQQEDQRTALPDGCEYDAYGNVISLEEKRAMEAEQIAIMEAIRNGNTASSSSQSLPTNAATPSTEEQSMPNAQPMRTVALSNNKVVALHDQTKTRAAIADGTAILVQCVACANWMQVAGTATLMFCPSCQSVSPVVRQNLVQTKEEAIQMTKDRKLAEALQREEDGLTEPPTSVPVDDSRVASSSLQLQQQQATKEPGMLEKWWYGETESKIATPRVAELPSLSQKSNESSTWSNSFVSVFGSSSNTSNKKVATAEAPISAHTGTTEDDETKMLILPPRTASNDSKNMFSCMLDSVSNMGNSKSGDEEDNIVVSSAGRFSHTVGDEGEYTKPLLLDEY